MKKEINKTLDILKQGGLILYPTDTIWGIGCDATNENAINRIYKLKKRPDHKAFITLVSDKKQLFKYTSIIPKIDLSGTPTTIIYPSVIGLSPKLLANNGSAAIRVVNDIFCQEIIKILGNPLVSTSANISGKKNPKKFSEVADEIKKNVDYIVNLRREELMSKPSKILLIDKDSSIIKIR